MMEESESVGNYVLSDVADAAMDQLATVVHRTPIMKSATTNALVGKHVYFKMENQQKLVHSNSGAPVIN